jgi:hypothetical protein
MDKNLESTDIFEYLMSMTWQEREKWQTDFHNQDLYYQGYICKIQKKYDCDDLTPYCGYIYKNKEDLGLFVIGESPYQYARDFWRTVDSHLIYKSHENTSA